MHNYGPHNRTPCYTHYIGSRQYTAIEFMQNVTGTGNFFRANSDPCVSFGPAIGRHFNPQFPPTIRLTGERNPVIVPGVS
jgi:hypothetical protein